MKKKGELTTKQIVTLIVLIASFAVILFFLFGLNLGQEQEKEVCHNSVLTRASGVIPDEAVSLNCRRSYVCLTADRTCEGMSDPVLHKVKTKEETFEALAEEMADCWWMFGEGNVNYAGKDLASKMSCAICSQIVFDDSMDKIFPEGSFEKEELYEYLIETSYSDEETYSQYLFGGVTSVDQIYQGEDVVSFFDSEGNYKHQYILTGMASKVSTLGWVAIVGGGAAVIAGGLAISPISGSAGLVGALTWAGTTGAVGSAGGNVIAKFIAPVLKGKFGDVISPSLIEANSPEFQALNCSMLATYA